MLEMLACDASLNRKRDVSYGSGVPKQHRVLARGLDHVSALFGTVFLSHNALHDDTIARQAGCM